MSTLDWLKEYTAPGFSSDCQNLFFNTYNTRSIGLLRALWDTNQDFVRIFLTFSWLGCMFTFWVKRGVHPWAFYSLRFVYFCNNWNDWGLAPHKVILPSHWCLSASEAAFKNRHFFSALSGWMSVSATQAKYKTLLMHSILHPGKRVCLNDFLSRSLAKQ